MADDIAFAKGIPPINGDKAVEEAKEVLRLFDLEVIKHNDRLKLLAHAVLHFHREYERLCLLAGRIDHLETTEGESMDWVFDATYPCQGYYIVTDDATGAVEPGERSEDPLGAGLDALERLRERVG